MLFHRSKKAPPIQAAAPPLWEMEMAAPVKMAAPLGLSLNASPVSAVPIELDVPRGLDADKRNEQRPHAGHSAVYSQALPVEYYSEPLTPPTGTSFEPPQILVQSSELRPERRVNVSTLRQWMADCEQLHGNHCHPESRTLEGRPIWLLDTKLNRVVRSHQFSKDRYVALSYVWGQVPSLTSSEKNLSGLQQPHALDSHTTFGREIPQTIRSAMELTRALGQRFLWVDSLCIVQDNEVHRDHQLSHMGEIYSGAELTIVAAAGTDANSEIPFCADEEAKTVASISGPPSKKRFSRLLRKLKLSQPENKLQSMPQAAVEPAIKPAERDSNPTPAHIDRADVERTRWAHRGWTFQELLFSKRIVFFTPEKVTWECHCARRINTSGMPYLLHDSKQHFDAPPRAFHDTDWPDVDLYAGVIRDYNSRDLTFPVDVTRAFSGIIGRLEKVFLHGFHYGLPLIFFDWALLWQPAFAGLKSRNLDNNQMQKRIPSWSWMAWKGQVDLTLFASAYDYVATRSRDKDRRHSRHVPSLAITPCVKWSFFDLEAEARTALPPSYRDFAESTDRASMQPPPGWSMNSDGRFQHQSDPHTQFIHPVPTAAECKEVQLISHRPPLLHCRAERSWFDMRSAGTLYAKNSGPTSHPIGFMHMQQTTDLTESRCEVIALSTGKVLLRDMDATVFPEIRGLLIRDSEGRPSDEYRFYNVLWIWWQDGIAFRRGLGRIAVPAWEDAEKQTIDVVLG